MSTLFRARSSNQQQGADDGGVFVDHEGHAGRYLTDGANLYRFLGAVPSGLGEMVGLENCRSLDVMLLPIAELRARRLRAVTPAARE
jgi:hypothetical protein